MESRYKEARSVPKKVREYPFAFESIPAPKRFFDMKFEDVQDALDDLFGIDAFANLKDLEHIVLFAPYYTHLKEGKFHFGFGSNVDHEGRECVPCARRMDHEFEGYSVPLEAHCGVDDHILFRYEKM